jgi:hypothetical protein
VKADDGELGRLAGDFDTAAREVRKKVARVTGTAMNKIKKDAQKRVRGFPHLPHLARSFGYDVTTRGDVITGEVGALHERPQGKLDVFVEFGSPTSRPIPHWAPAADREIPFWMQFLDRVAAEGLER